MSSGEAGIGIGMEHKRFRKPALCQCKHACPGDPVFLAPAANGMPPQHKQPVPEQREASGVSGYRVVVEVASHDRLQPLAGLGQGIMHSLAEFRFDASKLGAHALADRLAPNCKPSKAVFPTDVGKAQEVERLRFPFSSTSPVLFGEPAEFDPARLIRVEFQSKLS